MPDLQIIVQRMIDAGEPEENIATVIKQASVTASPQTASAFGQAHPIPMQGGTPARRLMYGPTPPEQAQDKTTQQRFIDMGGAEAIAGMLGGVLGGVPGAAFGAGATRYVRGRLNKETPQQAIGPAAGYAASEVGVPLVAKGLAKTGFGLLRAALPRVAQTFEELGHGNPWRGRDILAHRVGEVPGMTPRGVFESTQQTIDTAGQQLGEQAAKATAAGRTIPTAPIEQAGMEKLGGKIRLNYGEPGGLRAGNRIQHAFQQAIGGQTELTPLELRDLQLSTNYVPGYANSKAAADMTRTLRSASSRGFKEAVPESAAALRQQERLIPVRNTMAEMVPGAHSPLRTGEVIAGGNAAPRVLSVLAAPGRTIGFTGGKSLMNAGQALQHPIMPGFLRALWLQLQQQQMP